MRHAVYVRTLFELSAPSSAGVLVSYLILAYEVKCDVFFCRYVNKLKKNLKKVSAKTASLCDAVSPAVRQVLQRVVRQVHALHHRLGLGASGEEQRLPPGLLRVRRLQAAAEHRRGVRPARQPRALQGALPGDPGRRRHQQRWWVQQQTRAGRGGMRRGLGIRRDVVTGTGVYLSETAPRNDDAKGHPKRALCPSHLISHIDILHNKNESL